VGDCWKHGVGGFELQENGMQYDFLDAAVEHPLKGGWASAIPGIGTPACLEPALFNRSGKFRGKSNTKVLSPPWRREYV